MSSEFGLRENYIDYCNRFRYVWQGLKYCSQSTDKTISEVCEQRGYDISRMSGILRKSGILHIDKDKFDPRELRSADKGQLGLFSKSGNFILEDRYILPIRDMIGNVVALVGWRKNDKYITTPSRYFSKDCMFYGLEQLSDTGIGKKYVVVEGIFDSLSVRSLGLNCIAQMGSSSSRYKEPMYSLFKSILGIPDMDTTGISVVKNDEWNLPLGSKYMQWTIRGQNLGIKDIDDFCKTFSKEDVYDIINESFSDTKRVVNVDLYIE